MLRRHTRDTLVVRVTLRSQDTLAHFEAACTISLRHVGRACERNGASKHVDAIGGRRYERGLNSVRGGAALRELAAQPRNRRDEQIGVNRLREV